jgi:hypothetical protein
VTSPPPIHEPPNLPDDHDARGRLIEMPGHDRFDRLSPPRAAALCSRDRGRVSTAEGGLPARYEYGVVITKMAFDPYRLEREPVSLSKRANSL